MTILKRALLTVPLLLLLALPCAAQAETTGPQWKILSVANPTNFKPGDQSGDDAIVVTAVNVGGSSSGCTAEQIAIEEKEPRPAFSPLRQCTSGSPVVAPVTISDVVPAGMTAVEVYGDNAYQDPLGEIAAFTTGDFGEDNGPPLGLACTLSPRTPSCETGEPVSPGDTLVVTIKVHVETNVETPTFDECLPPSEAPHCQVDTASVEGGGALAASVTDPITISSAPAVYGVAAGGVLSALSTAQAGGHPNFTTEFFLNTISQGGGVGTLSPWVEGVSPPKDVDFDLPRGLLGTAVGVARCSLAAVVAQNDCPRNTMVGMATLMVGPLPGGKPRNIITTPVYNIAPAPGEPLALAFEGLFFPARIDTSVLSDGEYNARVSTSDLTGAANTTMASITIWGDPAEHSGAGPDVAAKTLEGNEFLRPTELGKGAPAPQLTFGGPGTEVVQYPDERFETVDQQRVPFLTNPTQCSESLTDVMETDSWAAPGPPFATESVSAGTPIGCGQLSFQAGVSMVPDTLEAGAPAGYAFGLTVPQNTEPEGLATPQVKRVSVTLPLGTVISPSAADGLGDCSSGEFELHSGLPGRCPRNSQVGEVEVESPDLEKPLTGDVYLGAPECTGPNGVCTPEDAAGGNMIHLYVQLVGKGEDGVVVKLEGKGYVNQQTGQITSVFDNTPQLPFSEFKLTLQGGERATLSNPRTCGEVHTTADLTPWSTPYTPDASPESNFVIKENCFGAQFNPSFSASTTSVRAGEFTPFTLSFGRSDSDEFLNGLQVQLPPGLLGMLSHVKLCEEPQANAGTCGPESQIGETTVETGPGADPFLVTGGKVYITGPYKGAPYGLSIVVPAKAGPYTLAGTTGNGTVVNRSAISVNPETSALTVTSDPLPTILDGIPLQLKLVNVTINRPEFIFNSTSCNKMAIGGTLTDTQAAGVNEASSYQVTNCQALKFQPKFTVSTSGKTSKAMGASLDAKVSYPVAGGGSGGISSSQGTQANIARVKVDLPKQLPSRLTTLQKACTTAVFDANPANCPAASVIGTVRVSTPVLPVQLTGPAIFVSHGGEAFPSLTIVLQGDGVRVDLVGATFISKAGITSTTFKTVPDVPFSSFELYLPEGKYSALAANGNLCKSSLAMPTEFVPQNGSPTIHESTKIAVTGCPKKKAVKKKKKKGKKASNARTAGTNGRTNR
jgi:hypothetical protein